MAKQQPILDLLAKELGYKDGGDLKKRLKQSHGDDFSGSLMSRLEDGQGIGESFKGGISDAKEGIKKAFSAKSIKQKLVQGAFGGDNVLSAFIRGKIKGKKLEANSLSPTPVGAEGAGGVGAESSLLESIAKSSMVLPDMARDMNTMQLNIKELVKVKGGKPATGASSFFRKQREEEEKLENDRKKLGTKKQEPGVPKPVDEGGGFLSGIFDMLKNGLFSAAKFIFNPKNLMSIIGKLALPLLIISTLFSGITDGFKKYQETGSLTDAIVAGLGGMLKFLTFGLFDESTIQDIFATLNGVFKPVIDTISGIFDSIKGFFKNIFGFIWMAIPPLYASIEGIIHFNDWKKNKKISLELINLYESILIELNEQTNYNELLIIEEKIYGAFTFEIAQWYNEEKNKNLELKI